MSPSVRMTAASGIGRQLATWLSCARSPSTSSVTAEQPRSACGRVASRLPGMMCTCCLYWLDNFMRRPCLVHEMSAARLDADGPHVLQPFDQAEHGGGLGGFRHLTQPGQPALAGFLLALRQCIEALPLFGGQPLG